MATDLNELEILWREQPGNYDTFAALQELYAERGNWRELMRLYQDASSKFGSDPEFGTNLVKRMKYIGEQVTEPEERGPFLVALGDALMNYAGSRDEAMKAYQESYVVFPADVTCLDRARAIYRKSSDFERIILLYKLELKVKTEPIERSRTLTCAAQIYGDDLRDLKKALEVLDQAIELDSNNALAADLKEIYTRKSSLHTEVQEEVKRGHELLRDGDTKEAAKKLIRAAKWESLREGGDLESALEWAREALTLDARNPEAQSLRDGVLDRLGREPEPQDSVVSVMAPVHLDTSDAREEAEEDQAEEEPAKQEQAEEEQAEEQAEEEDLDEDSDPADREPTQMLTPIQKKEIEEDLAKRQEGDSGEVDLESLDQLLKAISKNPESVELYDFVLEHPDVKSRSKDVDETLENALKRLRKKDGEETAMLAISRLHWNVLGDYERAEYWFKRLKLLNPEHPAVLAFYEEWYEQEEEWPKLFALLSSVQQQAESDDQKLEITRRLAELAENQMGSADKAINVWKSYQRMVPDDQNAHNELRTLYKSHQKWSALIDVYKEDLESQEGAEKLELLHEMAGIYEEHLRLEPMVIQTLQSILEVDPDDQDAFTKLKSLLESGRRYNDLSHILEQRAERAIASGNTAQAIECLDEAATIWQDNLRNVTQALPFLERILDIDPTHGPTLSKLKEVYEQRRDFKSLVEILCREAALEDAEGELKRLKEIRVLASEKTREPAVVIPVLERILEIDPQDAESLAELESMVRRSNEPERLVDLLKRRAELSEGDRISLLEEAAQILHNDLGQKDEAIVIWRQILETEPGHVKAFASLTGSLIRAMDLEGLDEVYRAQDKLDVYFELLDNLAPSQSDPRPIYRRMATLAAEDLEDDSRVIMSLEALREEAKGDSAEHTEVATELLPWYAKTGDVEKEITMNRVILENSDSEEVRLQTTNRLRELEIARGEQANALTWALESLKLNPSDSEALEAGRELAAQTDMMEVYLENLEDLSKDVDDDATQDQLWYFIAKEYVKLENWPSSRKYLEILTERHPSDLEFLGELESVLDKSGESERRIEVLRRQIDVLTERGAAREDLVDELSKIADVQRSALGESDSARKTYQEILDIDPEHLRALRGMKELYREDERWDDVNECLLREVNVCAINDPENRLNAILELADLNREKLGRFDEALRNYAEVLTEDPRNERALTSVETLLSEPEQAREAALLIEPIFRDYDRPEELIRALEARRAVASDRFEEAEILDELIPLYQRTENIPLAFERACRQFELDAERSEIWLRLEQLGAKLNRWVEIEEIFSRFAPTDASASATRFDLLRHLAAIREYQLNLKEKALGAWETLYEYDPLDSAHVEALERLYRQLGKHEELVKILQARADLVETPDEQVKLLLEAASISDDVLADSGLGVDIYRKLLLIEPEHRKASDELRRLLRDRESFNELGEHLASQADMASDPEYRKALRVELARLRFNEMADQFSGVDTLSQIFIDYPSDHELVAVAEEWDQTLAESGSTSLRVTLGRLTEPYYRDNALSAELVAVLSVRKDDESDVFERVALLDEITELLAEQGRNEEAFDACAEAVKILPDDEGRREKLEDLALRIDQVERCVDALKEAAENADPIVAGSILRRVGTLLHDSLDRPLDAIDAFETALEKNESDLETLGALEVLYQSTEDWTNLTRVLKLQAVFGEDHTRADYWRQIGTLNSDIVDEPDTAIEAFVEVLTLEPNDPVALGALERLYAKEERWEDVADILERITENVHEPELRRSSLEKLARLREDRSGDIQGAIDVWNQVRVQEPDATGVLDELARLYELESMWAELSEILRERRPLLILEELDANDLKLAEVLAKELYATEEALDLYREIFVRNPGSDDALQALAEMAEDEALLEDVAPDLIAAYSNRQEWEKLVSIHERLLSRETGPDLIARAREIARIQKEHLNDLESAQDTLAKSWLLDVENHEVRDELVSLAAQTNAFDALAQTYKDALLEAHAEETAIDLHLRLALLYMEQLESHDDAERHLREVLLADEFHTDAFELLTHQLTSEERWHDLVDVLESRFNAEINTGDHTALEHLRRIATIEEEFLQDEARATQTWRRVLEFNPEDNDADKELRRLYGAQEDWDSLNSHLIQQLAVAGPDTALSLREELATLNREFLLNESVAVDYLRENLSVDPSRESTIHALEVIFKTSEEVGLRAEIAQLLEPYYRAIQASDRLADALEAQAADTTDPERKVALLLDAAREAELVGQNLERAESLYAQVFVLSPNQPDAREALERTALRTQGWEKLVELYETTLRDNFEVDDQTRVALNLECATIQESRLENLESARESLEGALLLDPENAQALDALERIYARLESWVDLGELYRRKADLIVDPIDRKEVLEHLASLYEDVIEDPEASIDVHTEIVGLDPGDKRAQRALERLLHHNARWFDLADLYRNQAAQAQNTHEELEYRYRLAQLLETELDQLDESLVLYREILETDPSHDEARRALEGLSRDLDIRDGEWEEQRLQILDTLLNSYDRSRDREKVLRSLEQKVELTQDIPGKVEIFRQLAQLLDGSRKAEERSQAMAFLARAYQIDPRDQGLFDRVQELADELNAWERLPSLFLSGLELTDDIDAQLALMVSSANILANNLKDHESAVAVWQEVLRLEPNHEEAALQLEKLLGELEMWQPLVEILSKRAENVFEPGDQERIFKRIASIQVDVLGDVNSGIQTWEKLHELNPTRLEYVQTLESLYEQENLNDELERILSLKVNLVDDGTPRLSVLRKLANLQDEVLQDRDRAIESWGQILVMEPSDPKALNALTRLYELTERWPELLDVLEKQRDRTSGQERAVFELKAGYVLLEALNAPYDALGSFNAVLQEDPENVMARDAMTTLLERPETYPDAFETLEKAYEASEDAKELDKLYEVALEHSADPEERERVYLKLARLHEDSGSANLAFMTYGRALRDAPTSPDVRSNIERLSEELGNKDELVAVYEDCLDAMDADPASAAALHRRLGILYFELDEAKDAISHFEQALEFDEYDGGALDYLDRLYQMTHQWNHLRDVLERELTIANPARVNDVRYRLAYLHEVVFEDPITSLEHYRTVVSEEPEHAGAIAALERIVEVEEVQKEVCEILLPLYESADDSEGLVRILNLRVEHLDTNVERALTLERIADLEERVFARPAVAYAYLGRSLREEPNSSEVQERLEKLADENGLDEELVALYEDIIAELSDPVRELELSLVAAKRWAQKLNEPDEARRLFHRVLEIDLENQEALNWLEELARLENNHLELARVLRKKTEALFDPTERKTTLIELGKVLSFVEDFEGAIEAYREALMIDESDQTIMRALVDLYEIVEEYVSLVELLERLVDFVLDENERFQLFVRIGQYQRVLLKDNFGAIDAYRKALEYQPESATVLQALDELYTETEQWVELQEVFQRKLTLTSDPNERLSLLVRSASLSYEKFSDVAQAITDFEAAQEIDPNHPEVVAALDRLYTGEQRWDDLLGLYDRVIASSSHDPERVAQLRVTMADIFANRLGDPIKAVENLNAVLMIAPGHQEALSTLGDIYESAGDHQSLLTILQQQLNVATDNAQRLAVYLRRALLHRHTLNDPASASADLIEVIQLDPSHQDALKELKAIYVELGAWDQLYGFLDFEAGQADAEAKKATYLEMAAISRDKLKDPSKRIAALEKAYQLDAADLKVIEPLLDAYISGEAFDRAEPMLLEVIEKLKADRKMKDVVKFMHLRGKLAEQKGNVEEALQAYEEAHKVDASYIPNLLSLGKITFQKEDWDQALKLFQTLLLHQMNIERDDDKVDVYYYLGMVRWHQGDARRAKDMFTRALGIDPNHQPTRDALAQL